MCTFSKVRRAALLTTVLLGLCSVGAAQELTQGSREAVGFLGFSSSSGSGGIFGAGYGVALRPRIFVLGEIGYLTGGGGYGFAGSGFHSHGFEINANLHYLFPLTNLPKFTPYALGGIGFNHFSYSYDNTVFGCGTIISCNSSYTSAGVNIGGGARWQTGDNWGVRPEWKVLVGNHFAETLTVGVYYQFGK